MVSSGNKKHSPCLLTELFSDSDTNQDTSCKTTPSVLKASGEFEGENRDNVWDQEDDPVQVGLVHKLTEVALFKFINHFGHSD
jgi:hypothetical protein